MTPGLLSKAIAFREAPRSAAKPRAGYEVSGICIETYERREWKSRREAAEFLGVRHASAHINQVVKGWYIFYALDESQPDWDHIDRLATFDRYNPKEGA